MDSLAFIMKRLYVSKKDNDDKTSKGGTKTADTMQYYHVEPSLRSRPRNCPVTRTRNVRERQPTQRMAQDGKRELINNNCLKIPRSSWHGRSVL